MHDFFISLICSYESGVLENPANPAPKGLYQMTTDPVNAISEPEEIEIDFKHGYPFSVRNLKNGKSFVTPLAVIEYLNEVGGAHGVGRIDLVENRYIGLKVRLSRCDNFR